MKRTSRLPHWPPSLVAARGWLRWRNLSKPLLVLVTAAILTTLIFFHLEQYRVGLPAPRDVVAPRQLQWEDTDETQRRQLEAVSVVPTFFPAPDAQSQARDELELIYTLLRSPSLQEADREKLTELQIPPEIVDTARQVDAATLERLRLASRTILDQVMRDPIEEGSGLAAAEQRIETLTAERLKPAVEVQIVSAVDRAVLRPTRVRDAAKTSDLRAQARAAVPPVLVRYRPGDVIIRRGELVSRADLKQLAELRILTPAPLARVIPVAALMLFALTALGVYLCIYAPQVYASDRRLLLLAGLLVAAVWSNMALGGQRGAHVELIAIPAGSMAIAGLLGVPVALVSTMLTAVIAGLTGEQQFATTLLALGSSLAGVMAVSMIWPARRAVPAVLGLIGINLVLLVSVAGLSPDGLGQAFWARLGEMTIWAVAGATGATFVAVGAIYILARPFGITTHYRLMELSNPNEPLLRRLMIEAPGTYHSSVMVANIAEAAADAIGANAILTRVAALYHDIGKLKRPAFFVENQAPLGIENVHQRLSPKLSYLILSSHVRDGVELGRRNKLPEEIIAIIREHHGTTLAAYFYHRARNDARGEAVSEHEFRYPGPKPSTREAAVVMLSDSVQAAVKAIKEPTPNRIENMVHEIINNRLADGQLEDCDLTLRDLHRISEVFLRILTGLYTYSRLEYPDLKGEGTRVRANLNLESTTASSESTMLTRGS